jgi:hypothetical protein
MNIEQIKVKLAELGFTQVESGEPKFDALMLPSLIIARL